MGGHYDKDIFKQLTELMERCESMDKKISGMKAEHKIEVGKLNDRIDTLEKENDTLKRENTILKNDNERMKRILNNNSSNTSLPPSTDQKGKKANEYNSRPKTSKKQGAQPGHKGTTLTKEYAEQKLRSGKYVHRIETVGTPKGAYVSKYILDVEVVPIIREIRIYAGEDGILRIPSEYRNDVIYGNTVKSMAVDLYAEGVMSNDRICGFLNTISGNSLELSTGSVYGFCKSFSEKSVPANSQIEQELRNEPTVCTDATLVTVNGKQAYIRNFSSEQAVLYESMAKKDLESLHAISFLTQYAGNLEHDHETALYHFGSGHGECNVHLLRYLKKNTEESGSHWSKNMAGFLCGLNEERKKRIAENRRFTEPELASCESRYDEILKEGRLQNKTTRGCLAKQEEKTLLNRLEKYKKNHLLFLHDFTVPFQNNMSERDLRKCKNRQKIAGGFRKESGNEMYCRIMSIVETCKRKQMPVLENIKKIFEGTPAIF